MQELSALTDHDVERLHTDILADSPLSSRLPVEEVARLRPVSPEAAASQVQRPGRIEYRNKQSCAPAQSGQAIKAKATSPAPLRATRRRGRP